MKAYVYPADTAGCGTVRLIWAANRLRATGHDVVIIPPSSTTGIEGDIDSRTDTIVNVRVPDDADVLVFQRVLLKYIADAIPSIRRAGIGVVVDMDDDLTRIHPSNPAFRAMHPRYADPKRNWGHATRACLNASLVTVSTPALLKTYAPHGRGRVIQNCIPAGFLGIEPFGTDVFGWSGSVQSHPNDAAVVGSSVARLVREGFEFAMVSPATGVRKAFGLESDPFATGFVPIADYPLVVAMTIGVGIAPLADTKFNEAKSWLKPLEYAALGIPWVGSPSPEYRKLHREGAGLIARSPDDWYRKVRDLVTSDAYREEQAQAGRAVAAAHTVEAHAWRLWEAWSDAMIAERRARGGSPFTRRQQFA